MDQLTCDHYSNIYEPEDTINLSTQRKPSFHNRELADVMPVPNESIYKGGSRGKTHTHTHTHTHQQNIIYVIMCVHVHIM